MFSTFFSKSGGWRARLVETVTGDVLEVGVGTGANLPYYRVAASVSAIEPDPGRAGKARRAAQKAAEQLGIPVQVEVAPAEDLPFADATFDAAVSSLVFCSVAEPGQALAEIERVLRPGGVLWMIEHVRPQTPFLARLATFATPGWRRIAHNCHLDRPTLEILQETGWQVEVLRRRGVLVKIRAWK
ncbi:MAG: methyltransferase domain-containing protein [Caldilineaceae bacterium]|mgnify:CR=1 FL=1|nr:methyltransferase domain-containing protein [Caldilineaceae bacterium]HRJ41966.1 class I SAM-dependent methyltransferase [Caldilineaceae bacterium]